MNESLRFDCGVDQRVRLRLQLRGPCSSGVSVGVRKRRSFASGEPHIITVNAGNSKGVLDSDGASYFEVLCPEHNPRSFPIS